MKRKEIIENIVDCFEDKTDEEIRTVWDYFKQHPHDPRIFPLPFLELGAICSKGSLIKKSHNCITLSYLSGTFAYIFRSKESTKCLVVRYTKYILISIDLIKCNISEFLKNSTADEYLVSVFRNMRQVKLSDSDIIINRIWKGNYIPSQNL